MGYKLNNNIISLNGYEYKFWLSRPIKGIIKTLTIKRDNIGDFYLCISIEQEETKLNITTGKSVGIDFGLKQFLTLSDNTKFNSPLFHLKNISNLKSLNKNLSSKTCSCCGTINNSINKELKDLNNRLFKCPSCSFELDRDINASINIYRVGVSTLSREVVIP